LEKAWLFAYLFPASSFITAQRAMATAMIYPKAERAHRGKK
jgi:hypothetical protein